MKIAAFFFPIINTGGFFMELAAKLVFFVFVLNKAAEEVSFKIPRSKLIQLSVTCESHRRKNHLFTVLRPSCELSTCSQLYSLYIMDI